MSRHARRANFGLPDVQGEATARRRTPCGERLAQGRARGEAATGTGGDDDGNGGNGDASGNGGDDDGNGGSDNNK